MDSSSVVHWQRSRTDEAPPLQALQLLTLYLTERCNSRCASCDYWRSGGRDISLATVQGLLPELHALHVRQVLISGGEPLLHPQWAEIAALLRAQGLQTWLLTAGLALAKHAQQAARLFDAITVSLDAADAQRYAGIRGVNAFEAVCAGVRAVAAAGRPAGLRVTVQRGNCGELPALVKLAHQLGAASISFLAADVGHGEAFGRGGESAAPEIALREQDLPLLEDSLTTLEREHAADFESGFIQEPWQKLRRLPAYSRALLGLGEFPAVRCNAPEHSAVIEADGRLRPCFFIAGSGEPAGLEDALNSLVMRRLRADIQAGARPECQACVCSKWFP